VAGRKWPLSLTRYSQRVWGAVAQLGERLVRNEEVSGSIPLGSTKPRPVFRITLLPSVRCNLSHH
jgi:hypothetical protein